MAALGIIRFLTQLKDVDDNGLPDSGVPQWQTAVSSFVVETIAGGGGGSFSLGASNLGNTLGDTGVTGTRVVLAGIGNLTLSQATDANGGTISISAGTAGAGGVAVSASNSLFSSGTVVLTGAGGGATVNTVAPGTIQISVAAPVAQTVQTQNLFDLTAAGNTAGVLALVSSGTLTLAGGNSITLSQNGNAITISGASTSQSVQTQNLVAVTLSGNTSGVLALASSGTVTLAGGNNITLSQAGNAITISGANAAGAQTAISGLGNSETTYTSGTVKLSELGAITIRSTTGNQFQFSVNAQSVQPETQTFLGGISASDTLYTSGTVRFTGVGGGVTVSSNTGQRVDISVAAPVAQTVQTQNVVDVTLSGNTAGALALISSGTMTLAGGNNITISQAGNAITISGPNVGGAQTGISGIFASDASYTSGTVEFTGSNMITVKSSAGQRVVIDATQSVQPGIQNLVASDATFSSGTVTISGFGDVTVNTAANLIRISAPVQTAESQSFGMSNIGNTSGTTGIASGAQVRFLLAGGNNVTLSQSINGASGTITISAFNQTVQTQNAVDVTLSGNTAGALALVSSGTMTLAGGNNITLSQAGNAVTISGPNTAAQTAESQSIGMSNIGNTSGTTGIASGAQVRMLFAGGNNVTLSQSLNGASGTITVSAANQTGTQFSAGLSNIGNTAGDTVTVGGRLILAGGNGITLSGSSNGVSQTITISGVTQSVESQSIGMSNIGNTSGTTGIASGGQVRFVFAGGNNITLSQSLNGASGTITISAPNLGAGAMSAGVSNLGNSAGATGITGTQLVFVGSDNITLSQTTGANGGTVSIIGGAGGGFSAGVSTGGNTAGATGVSGTRMVLVGTNAISLSQTTGAAGNTVSIDAPVTSSIVGVSGISISTNGSTISVFQTSGGPPMSMFNPYGSAPQTSGAQGQATLHMQPANLAQELRMDRVMIPVWISNASNSSNSITLSNWVGIYTRNASTLSMVTSISTSTNFSGSGTVGSYTLYGGRRWVSMALSTTLSQGDYWIAIVQRSTTGGGAGHTVAQILLTQQSNATFSGWSGILGAATNATQQTALGHGVYTVSTAGVPGSIAFTELNGTGTMVMMAPMYQLRSGTV